MRLILLSILLFGGATINYAQTNSKSYGRVDVTIIKQKKTKRLLIQAAIISAFTGGDSTWVQSLENTLSQTISYKNGARFGVYLVSVGSISDKAGNLSDIRLLNDSPGYGIAEAVIRAIKKKTVWRPAPQGVPVRPYRSSSSRNF